MTEDELIKLYDDMYKSIIVKVKAKILRDGGVKYGSINSQGDYVISLGKGDYSLSLYELADNLTITVSSREHKFDINGEILQKTDIEGEYFDPTFTEFVKGFAIEKQDEYDKFTREKNALIRAEKRIAHAKSLQKLMYNLDKHVFN